MKILNIGCDNGQETKSISERYRTAEVFGTDINKTQIDFAKDNYSSERIKFFCCPAENLPFKEESFDMIFCFEVLEHVKNLKKSLSEIKRVAKKNARIEISFPSEESEKELSKINRGYFKQIGHRRIINREKLICYLNKEFIIKKNKKFNSIEHLFWKNQFKKKRKILDQNARMNAKVSLLEIVPLVFLNRQEYKTRKNSIKIIKILFWPLAILLDLFLINKRIKLVLIKNG